ncbi:MAG TPA: alpha-amylase family glycosyl hydrolase [Roseiflexaceae bacterium]|nr:alpha-amylase family glycosyl hydrolase [Roseiflexaceae bacterium]
MNGHPPRWLALLALIGLLTAGLVAPARPAAAQAAAPASVTVVGDLQSELGCPGDWDPACAAAHLVYDPADDVWQGSWTLPAGSYQYKVALNDGWAENYGQGGVRDGANIALSLAAPTAVKFYYEHGGHWVVDSAGAVIATVPGSFQSELGCPGDWDPSCLRSWLKDVDGDGVYRLETTALPAGSYEAKVAIGEGWAENYGQNGVRDGANFRFSVPNNGAKVVFTWVAATKVMTILAGHGADNNVEWDGLRHDSRDTLYRAPGGAVPAGTPVKLRFRTFHNDASAVRVRLYDLNAGGQRFQSLARVAEGVECFQAELAADSCDYWETTVVSTEPNNFWYRFVVQDGSGLAYYGDNTSALDGGLGAPSAAPVDQSYALMFYDPQFRAPEWAKDAVIYQIFPDRFRNGDPRNDPRTGDRRYDDPVLKLPWNTLPEGFCRNYTDGATNCPWRFDTTPPDWSPTKEGPSGRDYMGGDLKGVTEKLDYLQRMGITALYFNPIFAAGSNHRYDTRDYYAIDPSLGTLGDFRKLVTEAKKRNIRVILDGVFNHMSSDSPLFDRYGAYKTVGACESAGSPYRGWFLFRAPAGLEPAVCAGGTYYDGWFGFDSIPTLNKNLPAVQEYFVTGSDSVSRYWLRKGAAGWRLDVMGDPSFPNGYWEQFRQVVKQTDPEAVIIGELWQKDSTLLRYLRGDRADTTMNYRLRDAVLGLLAPGSFDAKGFGDSGRVIKPSEFAARIEAVREDYPDAAFYSLMNLLGSHDTARLLWVLTPGEENRAGKEDPAALAEGKQRQRLAALIQFTMPGAPTVYYGDEVGVTGADDPDDRRTFPWPEQGGNPDRSLVAFYSALAHLRSFVPALSDGDLRVLLADDAAETLAYGRKGSSSAAVVVVNRSKTARTVTVPLAGYLPEGLPLLALSKVDDQLGAGLAPVRNGAVQVQVGPLGYAVLLAPRADLRAPAAPAGLAAQSGDATVALSWGAVPGAAGYNVYRSPVSGGGYVKLNNAPLTGTSFADSGLRNAQSYFYVVRAVNRGGLESAASNEAAGLPRLAVGWANLQWPPALTHTISTVNRTSDVYGQVFIADATQQPGRTPTLRAQLGFGPQGSNPATAAGWSWVEAEFNTDAGNNDEFKASLLPEAVGTFDYVYRYSTTGGREWIYADQSGPLAPGAAPASPGRLDVLASADTAAPATPANLRVLSASPDGVTLAWDAVAGDPTLYGYEVLRATVAGGPYTPLGRVTAAGFSDTDVVEGSSYFYVVRAVDLSLNRSPASAEVKATAELRTVTVRITLTVPASTDATGRSATIAGFLDRLDGGLPQWNPGGVQLTRLDSTTWQITLTGKEATQIEYKYALGSWDFVEKDGACGEVANRQLTLSYGTTGVQQVSDSVLNWRNVAPCGN